MPGLLWKTESIPEIANRRTRLVAQRNLLVIQDQLADARGNLAQNRIALYRALGGGWHAEPVVFEAETIDVEPIDP